MSDKFKNFFINIGKTYTDKITPSYNVVYQNDQNISNTIYLSPTDEKEVLTTIKALKNEAKAKTKHTNFKINC